MSPASTNHFLIVGAGAAGLMAARELARAGRRITILEARDRCGGRICPLPSKKFGYTAEGGAEFVHGAAPLTRALIREAGLSFVPRTGTRWRANAGVFSRLDRSLPHLEVFHQALAQVKTDLPIAEFLVQSFAGPTYAPLRRDVTRMVMGYDLADPGRASALAIRDEWQAREEGQHGRIAEGYGALVAHLAAECRSRGTAIHFGASVAAIEERPGMITARCRDGGAVDADGVVLAVPLPILSAISLPSSLHPRLAALNDIGFGNVVKILLRFRSPWWSDQGGYDLSDLGFLRIDTAVPTWWTQHPAAHPVLTGWCPTLRLEGASSLSDSRFVELGLESLSTAFRVPVERLRNDLVASQAMNWGNDPFARGAYSYATPFTRKSQEHLSTPDGHAIYFAGEAFYPGPDMGTVEAALASGQHVARTMLAARQSAI